MLALDLLNRLEAAWRAQGAEIAGVLAPGLSNAEIDAIVAPTGLDLPDEARAWWGWHDGVSVSTPRGWEIGPDIGIYSLRQAVAELQQPLGGGGEEAPVTWLPLAQAPGGPICVDCSEPQSATVHRIDVEHGFFPGAGSMAEMVQVWLDMYDSGAWRWSRDDGRWGQDVSLRPERVAATYVI